MSNFMTWDQQISPTLQIGQCIINLCFGIIYIQPAIKVNIIWFHLMEMWALLPPTCFFCSMENKINLSTFRDRLYTHPKLNKDTPQNRHSWKKIQFSKPFLVSMPSNCWRFDPRWINLRWLCIRMHFTVDRRNPAPIAMASIPVFTRFCISTGNWCRISSNNSIDPTRKWNHKKAVAIFSIIDGWESYFMNGLQKGDGVIFSWRNQMVLEDELKHHWFKKSWEMLRVDLQPPEPKKKPNCHCINPPAKESL